MFGWQIVATEHVEIKEAFQKNGHVTPCRLMPMGHKQTHDLSLIELIQGNRRIPAEHLREVGLGKMSQEVENCSRHPAALFEGRAQGVPSARVRNFVLGSR